MNETSSNREHESSSEVSIPTTSTIPFLENGIANTNHQQVDEKSSQTSNERQSEDEEQPPQPHPAETPLRDGVCPLMDLPAEILLQILGNLLHNSSLSYPVSVSEIYRSGYRFSNYQLHPAILEVNRDLNVKGEEILYNHTFFAVAIDRDFGSDYTFPICPLTRK